VPPPPKISRPSTPPPPAPPPPSISSSAGSGESLSIEETNRIRAKLGLKPLQVDQKTTPDLKDEGQYKNSTEQAAAEAGLSVINDDLGEFVHKPAGKSRSRAQNAQGCMGCKAACPRSAEDDRLIFAFSAVYDGFIDQFELKEVQKKGKEALFLWSISTERMAGMSQVRKIRKKSVKKKVSRVVLESVEFDEVHRFYDVTGNFKLDFEAIGRLHEEAAFDFFKPASRRRAL